MFNELMEAIAVKSDDETVTNLMIESVGRDGYINKGLSISENVSEEDIMNGDAIIISPEEESKLLKLIELIPDGSDTESPTINADLERVIENVIPVSIANHRVKDIHSIKENVDDSLFESYTI